MFACVESSPLTLSQRDDTLSQQWLHFPSCPAPVSPNHQSHRPLDLFRMFVQFFFSFLSLCSRSAEAHCSVEWQHSGVIVCLYSGGTATQEVVKIVQNREAPFQLVWNRLVVNKNVFAHESKTCALRNDVSRLLSTHRPAASEIRHFNLKYKYPTACRSACDTLGIRTARKTKRPGRAPAG